MFWSFARVVKLEKKPGDDERGDDDDDEKNWKLYHLKSLNSFHPEMHLPSPVFASS